MQFDHRDTLTPLDARNTLLMQERQRGEGGITTFSMASAVPDSKERFSRDNSPDRYLGAAPEPANSYSRKPSVNNNNSAFQRSLTPNAQYDNDGDRETLISHAAPISQQPTLPNVGGGYGGGGGGGYYSNQGGYAPYRGY